MKAIFTKLGVYNLRAVVSARSVNIFTPVLSNIAAINYVRIDKVVLGRNSSVIVPPKIRTCLPECA